MSADPPLLTMNPNMELEIWRRQSLKGFICLDDISSVDTMGVGPESRGIFHLVPAELQYLALIMHTFS